MAFELSEVWTFPHSGVFLYNNESYEFSLPKNSLHNIVLLWLLDILKFGLSHIPEFPLQHSRVMDFHSPKHSLHNIVFMAIEHSVVWTFPHSGVSSTTRRVMNFHSPKNSLHNIVYLWLLNFLKFGLSHIPEFPLQQ